VPVELGKQIQKCSKELGLFAANMAEDAVGGGLDYVFVTLLDRELGKSIGGLMNELALEMLWRDARVERFRDGTGDIQRHIISRELLRPHEA
jgi:alkylation response protein AidB-like acyl-CoA dehydrogenase